MSKILIIDGHSILNRGFYGLPDLTNSRGIHTNAVLGFLNILFKIMDEEKPDHLCVAFDMSAPTFRHERFKEYKGTRKPMPEELREQVPLMKRILTAMNVRILEHAGYEADDIIGTMSRVAEAKGYDVTIVSGDRDLLQLATDRILIRIPKTKTGGTTVENYYSKDVVEHYGVTPVEFIDMKGLMGDTSDNIPGVPKIGEKTASKIISAYGSIENAYEHIDEIKPALAQKNLREYYDQAIFSKWLATIKLDCELDCGPADCLIDNMFNEESYKLFNELELKSILKRFDFSEKKTELSPDIVMVLDEKKAEQVFAEVKNTGKAGFYIIHGDEEMLGMAVSCSVETVYIMQCFGYVREEYITDKLIKLAEGGVELVTLDLKEALHFVHFTEDMKRVRDIGVAAYLLNPLADTYYYDDIARDYIDVALVSEKELIGKEAVNIFSFANDDFNKCMAYKALVPYAACDRILEEIDKKGCRYLYDEIEMRTVYCLYDMESRGVLVRRDELDNYSHMLEERIQVLQKQITDYAGREFNINSPKQLGQVLFEEMQIPGGKKTKTGYSTSVDVLDKIKNEHPIINDILEYRQLTKLNSTYAIGLTNYISDDGRIHGTFNQTITATGRISSTEPNLQNIPMRIELGRMIRKAFVPKEGYVFVDADYSQIELRVLAHMSGDKVMQEAFLHNVDVHATTASQVFNVPIDEVTSLQRRNAKAVNFGIVYGISAFGLSEDLGISRKEAASYIEAYFNTYKDIKKFLDEQVAHARENGYVKTMFGRIRPVPELSSSNFMQKSFGERVAMNSPIQGTAADIIKIAMINVNSALKNEGLKSRLILQIHDELLIETAKDEIEQVKDILTREMMNAAKLQVPLSVDVETGDNWYDAK